VHSSEGLPAYTQARAAKYEGPDRPVLAALLALNPVRELWPATAPISEPGVVGFRWRPEVDEAQRQRLEEQQGLRSLDRRDDQGRSIYAVENVYDARLLELDSYINDGIGFRWDRLQEIRQGLPTNRNVALWIEQMTLLVPVLLLASAARAWWSHRRQQLVSVDVQHMLVAGALLVVADSLLFREPSYFVTVAPLTAALGARFLPGTGRGAATRERSVSEWHARLMLVGRAVATLLLLLTTGAAVVWGRQSLLFHPSSIGKSMSAAFSQLLSSPPVEGRPEFRYFRDCTASTDRLFVTGPTPFHVPYYTERAFAGGHLFWHSGWGADDEHEALSLALLQRQSVPFAVSTQGAVLDDVSAYPRVRDYLATNYVVVEGSHGAVMADRRRRAVRAAGPDRMPCFR
jgi:hypothetical protein